MQIFKALLLVSKQLNGRCKNFMFIFRPNGNSA